MANCKVCGQAVTTGEVIHTTCRESRAHQIMGLICDKLCKYPDICRDGDELDRHCDGCQVADLLGCK